MFAWNGLRVCERETLLAPFNAHTCVQLRQAFLELVPEPGDCDGLSFHDVEKVRRKRQTADFPGSQPVSLSASNQDLIYNHRCASACERFVEFCCYLVTQPSLPLLLHASLYCPVRDQKGWTLFRQ